MLAAITLFNINLYTTGLELNGNFHKEYYAACYLSKVID